MPRLRSRNRGAGDLTDGQRQVLELGETLSDGDDFDSDDAAREAWRLHRHELLSRAQPGRRPWSFYRWDLGMESPPWDAFGQLAVLLDHQLISGEEAFAIEREYRVLSPDQPENFNSAWESADFVLRQSFDHY